MNWRRSGRADQAGSGIFFANRLRATSAAAAAPNNRTIGGAGTGAGGPPLDPVLPPVELPWPPLLLLQPPFELQPPLLPQPLLLEP
jgi:hypothetical protein